MKYFTTSKISENILETPEGYLVCFAVPIARTGEMIYGEGETPLKTDKDGRITITRDEEEVFRLETIASFEGKPLTIGHPDDFVAPDNWKDLSVGSMQHVRRGEGDQKDDLIADILVTDAIAIGLIKRGLREVSCGYEAEYTQTGVGLGRQTNIVGNHLALVEQGRAGPAYAINDHKGVSMKTKIKEKLTALFAKTADEFGKAIDEEMPKEDKKDDAKDAEMPSFDEVLKAVKDLGEKLDAMKPKDEEKKDEEKPAADAEEKKDDKEEPAKDEGEGSVEDRLKALEMAVAKLMEGESEEEESVDDKADGDKDDAEDAEGCYDEDEGDMTGDSIARAEILAPGIAKSKDMKAKALKAAYGTKDGRKVIESLTGGKAPTFDSAEKVDHLFIAASEIMKASRRDSLTDTRRVVDSQAGGTQKGAMTPERLNEINKKFWDSHK